MVAKNIDIVKGNIVQAAQAAGRNPAEIQLVAVSKTVPAERIEQAIQAGHNDFGENYAQEMRDKVQQIDTPVNWHFIGQLQSNKVKYIIDDVYLIQSVDRPSLAKEIQKRARQVGRTANVLLQVSLEAAQGRGGTGEDNARRLLEECAQLDALCVRGLMSVAPFGQTPDETEHYFEAVYRVYNRLRHDHPDNARMDILSMGMSGDYEQAVRQGSTMLRIGTAIFGGRS